MFGGRPDPKQGQLRKRPDIVDGIAQLHSENGVHTRTGFLHKFADTPRQRTKDPSRSSAASRATAPWLRRSTTTAQREAGIVPCRLAFAHTPRSRAAASSPQRTCECECEGSSMNSATRAQAPGRSVPPGTPCGAARAVPPCRLQASRRSSVYTDPTQAPATPAACALAAPPTPTPVARHGDAHGTGGPTRPPTPHRAHAPCGSARTNSPSTSWASPTVDGQATPPVDPTKCGQIR